VSEATYKIRPLKWQKSFGEYCQRYSAKTEPWSFFIERWRKEIDGQFGPWKLGAEYDDRGDPIYIDVKSAIDGKKRCDEIYRQRLETMLVRVQEEDESE